MRWPAQASSTEYSMNFLARK